MINKNNESTLFDITVSNEKHNKISQRLKYEVSCKFSHVQKKNCYKINRETDNEI